jgi:hypothetical protein
LRERVVVRAPASSSVEDPVRAARFSTRVHEDEGQAEGVVENARVAHLLQTSSVPRIHMVLHRFSGRGRA